MDEQRHGLKRFFETYLYEGSRYLMIHDPRSVHNELLYVRVDFKKKAVVVVFGQGVNGKGAVADFRWFF